MGANRGVSPSLSQLEIRIRNLKAIRDSIESCEADILRYESAIESLGFNLVEFRADERFNKDRIEALLDNARKEGFDDKYLERFLKERRCTLDE